MVINEKLKARRLELGLTMAEVAKIVGVSEATVSRWESGNIGNMKRDRIALYAKALQVSPAYIMGTDDELWDKESNEFLVKMYNEEVAYKKLLKQAFDNEEDIEIAYDIIINLYTLDTKGLKNVRSMEETIIEIGGYDKMK